MTGETMHVPVRTSLCVAAVIFAAMLGSAPAEAAGEHASGQIDLELQLKVNPAIPDGTACSVNATADASDSTYSNFSYAFPSATVEGGVIKTTATIYYNWKVASKSDTLSIQVSISATGGSYNAFANFDKTIALPADGAVTKVTIDDSL